MRREMIRRFRRAISEHKENLFDTLSKMPAVKWDRLSTGLSGTRRGSGEVPVIHELGEVLTKIDHGTFGRCAICGEDVEQERLELDFSTSVCLDHYTELERRELERDLELAAKIQQQLFPNSTPAIPGVEVAAHAVPAHFVSGDYYDFFTTRDLAQGLVVADVMGKGVAASMLMANLQASIRILGPEYEQLHQLTARLNELFRRNLKLVRFITLFLAAIDTENKLLRYCNAGHNPALLLESSTGTSHWLRPTGPAIGVLSESTYHSDFRPYHKGDILIVYTDGIVEANNGEGRLKRYVECNQDQPAGQLLAGLWQEVEQFADKGVVDDTTLVVVRF